MKVRDLGRDQLMAVAQQTYDKSEWSQDDIMTLRACWQEMEKRGGFNAVMFFRGPGFSSPLMQKWMSERMPEVLKSAEEFARNLRNQRQKPESSGQKS